MKSVATAIIPTHDHPKKDIIALDYEIGKLANIIYQRAQLLAEKANTAKKKKKPAAKHALRGKKGKPKKQMGQTSDITPPATNENDSQQNGVHFRRSWSPEEITQFERGCMLHGWGNWKQIQSMIPGSYAARYSLKYPHGKKRLVDEHQEGGRNNETRNAESKSPTLATALPKKAFPKSTEVERFAMLVRALLTHLEQSDSVMYHKANTIMQVCFDHHKRRHPMFVSLQQTMESLLRLTVGESHWTEARHHFQRSLGLSPPHTSLLKPGSETCQVACKELASELRGKAAFLHFVKVVDRSP